MIKFTHRILEAQELSSYSKSEIEIALDKIGINQDNYNVGIEDGKANIEIFNISPKASKEIKNKLPSLVTTLNISDMRETKSSQPVVNLSILGEVEATEEYEKINTPETNEVLEDEPIDDPQSDELPEEPSPSDKIAADIESKILDEFPDIETISVQESISVPGTIVIEGKTDPVTFKGIINLLKTNYKDYTTIGSNAYSYTTGNFQAGLVPN